MRMLLAVSILSLGAATAHAQTRRDDPYRATAPDIVLPPACSFSEPGQMVTTMKGVPGLALEFKRHRIEIADAGEPFYPTDVVGDPALPQRQFLRAYVFPRRTIVWYFHGGRGGHVHVINLQYQPAAGGGGPLLRIMHTNLTGPPCQTTQAILDGVANFSVEDW